MEDPFAKPQIWKCFSEMMRWGHWSSMKQRHDDRGWLCSSPPLLSTSMTGQVVATMSACHALLTTNSTLMGAMAGWHQKAKGRGSGRTLWCSPYPEQDKILTCLISLEIVRLCPHQSFSPNRPCLSSIQRLRNHYAIQQMAFSSGTICGFSTPGVADICRQPCDLRSKTQIPPSQESRKLSQNPVAVFSCSG